MALLNLQSKQRPAVDAKVVEQAEMASDDTMVEDKDENESLTPQAATVTPKVTQETTPVETPVTEETKKEKKCAKKG